MLSCNFYIVKEDGVEVPFFHQPCFAGLSGHKGIKKIVFYPALQLDPDYRYFKDSDLVIEFMAERISRLFKEYSGVVLQREPFSVEVDTTRLDGPTAIGILSMFRWIFEEQTHWYWGQVFLGIIRKQEETFLLWLMFLSSGLMIPNKNRDELALMMTGHSAFSSYSPEDFQQFLRLPDRQEKPLCQTGKYQGVHTQMQGGQRNFEWGRSTAKRDILSTIKPMFFRLTQEGGDDISSSDMDAHICDLKALYDTYYKGEVV